MPCSVQYGVNWWWNCAVQFRAETDVVEPGEKSVRRSYLCYFWTEKTSAEPSRLLYLQPQVFHTQSLGYSAQGHSKCGASVFQTTKNVKSRATSR